MNEKRRRLDLRLRDLNFRIHRKLFGERSIFEVAEREWEIAPAGTLHLTPSIMLPGQFDKIIKFEANTRRDIEERRAFGGDFERSPVKAFRFRNAALYKGAYYCRRRARRVLPFEIEAPAAREYPALRIKQGALASSMLGLRYFAHWLKDDAPLSILAAEYGEAVSLTPPNWHSTVHKKPHYSQYASLLELPTQIAENVLFDELVVFDDETVTSHKAERLRRLRELVKKKFGPMRARKRVFIKRGVLDAGARRFNNEESVAAALVREGFTLIDPVTMSVEDIAESAYGAELVVGMEGSHLGHAVYFARDGANILAISPPERFNMPFKQWTELLAMQYGFVVGDAEEEGFSANIDDVLRTIELFDRFRADRS